MEVQYSREIKFMEHLPLMICLGDAKKDEIISLNAEGRRIIGEDYKEKRLSEVFGDNREFNKHVMGDGTPPPENLTYGHLLNGRWMMMSISAFVPEGKEDLGEILIITGNDVTTLKRHGYFDSVSARDPETGVYTTQAGINYLENYLYGLDKGGDHFTLAYIRFGPGPGPENAEAFKAYTMNLINILKSVIRGTDVFAFMTGMDYFIVFPRCTFEIVDMIMTTVDNRLEMMNNTGEDAFVHKIDYAIMEIDKNSAAERDVILEKITTMLP